MRAFLIVLWALLLWSDRALADRVWLDNGNYIDGESYDLGNGQVEIRSTIGVLTVPKAKVTRIQRAQSVEHVVRQSLGELPAGDARGRFELALWCKEQGSNTLARRLLRQVIAIDPDHAEARRELGYVYYDGQWRSAEELRALRGEVYFRGEWITPEERGQILAAEALGSQIQAAQREQIRQARLQAEILRLQQQAALPSSGLPYSPFGFGSTVPLVPAVVAVPQLTPTPRLPPAPVTPRPSVRPGRPSAGGHNVGGFRPPAPRPQPALPRLP